MTGLERSTVSPSSSTMTREHPVGGRVRRPQVEDHGLVLGGVHVDVGGVELHALRAGAAPTRTPRSSSPAGGAGPGPHLLAALVGLGLEDLGQLGRARRHPAEDPVAEAQLAGLGGRRRCRRSAAGSVMS